MVVPNSSLGIDKENYGFWQNMHKNNLQLLENNCMKNWNHTANHVATSRIQNIYSNI